MADLTHGPLRIAADPAWGWCAGFRHPPEAEYPAGFFTPGQLDQLRADPALRVEELEAADGSRAASTGAQSPADGAAAGGGDTLPAATNPEADAGADKTGEANGADAPAQEADVPAAASASDAQGGGSGAPVEAAAPAATVAVVPSGGEAGDAAKPAEGAAVAPSASPAPASSTTRRRRN